jgi:hypothetical protein
VSDNILKGRRVGSVGEIERPGDYCGPVTGYTGDLPAVFFLKPNARDEGCGAAARSVQHVCSPPHTFRECPDGSLEIRASISNLLRGDTTGHSDDGWRGYLDEGHVWRKVLCRSLLSGRSQR